MDVGSKFLWKDQIVDRNQVAIDIFDRGYNFGDGIYEVIHIYNGRLFTCREHLERLFNSAARIELNLGKSFEQVNELVNKLVQVNEVDHGHLYLQITRGDNDLRWHGFRFYADQEAVFHAYTVKYPRNTVKIETPVNAITTEDLRGSMCDVKSLNLLPNVLAMHQAQKQNAQMAILVHDNIVTEEKSNNVIIVKDGILYTHPDGKHILPGITKLVIKRICRQAGIPYIEKPVTLEELYSADEVLTVSTNAEVVSIKSIDNQPIGNADRGEVARRIQELYEDEIVKSCGGIFNMNG